MNLYAVSTKNIDAVVWILKLKKGWEIIQQGLSVSHIMLDDDCKDVIQSYGIVLESAQ